MLWSLLLVAGALQVAQLSHGFWGPGAEPPATVAALPNPGISGDTVPTVRQGKQAVPAHRVIQTGGTRSPKPAVASAVAPAPPAGGAPSVTAVNVGHEGGVRLDVVQLPTTVRNGRSAGGEKVMMVTLERAPDVRMDVDLQDLPVREAISRVFQSAGQKFSLQDDLPSEHRVTLRAKAIRLTAAVQFIVDAAGGSWVYEDGVFRVGRNVTPRQVGLFSGVGKSRAARGQLVSLDRLPTAVATPRAPAAPSAGRPTEIRATFTCPMCRHQATVVQNVVNPNCGKCRKPFQPGWKFCPADGARRPSALPEWRYCPHCGKAVKLEAPATPEMGGVRPVEPVSPVDPEMPMPRPAQTGNGPEASDGDNGPGWGGPFRSPVSGPSAPAVPAQGVRAVPPVTVEAPTGIPEAERRPPHSGPELPMQ